MKKIPFALTYLLKTWVFFRFPHKICLPVQLPIPLNSYKKERNWVGEKNPNQPVSSTQSPREKEALCAWPTEQRKAGELKMCVQCSYIIKQSLPSV